MVFYEALWDNFFAAGADLRVKLTTSRSLSTTWDVITTKKVFDVTRLIFVIRAE